MGIKHFRKYPLGTMCNKDQDFSQMNKLLRNMKEPLLWLQPVDWLIWNLL